MPLIIHLLICKCDMSLCLTLSFSLFDMRQSLNYNVPRSFPNSREQEISQSRPSESCDLVIYSRQDVFTKNLRDAKIYYEDPGKDRKEIRLACLFRNLGILVKCSRESISMSPSDRSNSEINLFHLVNAI